jgi:transglutaminase-like putative cysteine protease
MKLKVRHQLRYTYSDFISLEPHTLYLAPKAYPHQRVLDYGLIIDPNPIKIVKNMSAEDNCQHVVFFKDRTNYLTITANITVQSDDFNVFDFVLYPFETQRLPFIYADDIKPMLQPYLLREGITMAVEQFTRQLANEAKWQTVNILTNLCQYIRQNFGYERREEGLPYPPEYTLSTRKGTCRDFAQLFIVCCRSLGLAARFVSGYLYGSQQQAHELHAWAEVYLPGAGWRGFDPTEGSAVVNNYIYLATSANAALITPVSGTFRGTAQSSLTAEVDVDELL